MDHAGPVGSSMIPNWLIFNPTLSRPSSPAPLVGTSVSFEERAALGECLGDQAPSQSGSSVVGDAFCLMQGIQSLSGVNPMCRGNRRIDWATA